MILSLALQPGATDSAIRFISKQPNLFNVALTRARAALVVVGNSKSAEVARVEHISAFVEYVDSLRPHKDEHGSRIASEIGDTYPEEYSSQSVSDFEIKLNEALFKAGIKTLPQFKVGPYRLDLALIVGDRKLDIEIDGDMYHRHWTGENIRRDVLRNQRLIELGWDVQRFWVYQVQDDVEKCVERVKRWIINDTSYQSMHAPVLG
jgi:very-short-patch-repair endonuclease